MSSKAGKTLAKLVSNEDKKEMKSKKNEIMAALNDPGKLKLLAAAAKLDNVKEKKRNAWDEKFKTKRVKDIPHEHILFKWLPKRNPGVNTAIAKALKNADKAIGQKFFRRVHMASGMAAFGPLEHSDWYGYWDVRFADVNEGGAWPKEVTWDGAFRVDWHGPAGHFQLAPMPDDETPIEEHEYKFLVFMGESFALPANCPRVGRLLVDLNWDHMEAMIVNPLIPTNAYPCREVIKEAASRLVPQLQDPSMFALADSSQLSIADKDGSGMNSSNAAQSRLPARVQDLGGTSAIVDAERAQSGSPAVPCSDSSGHLDAPTLVEASTQPLQVFPTKVTTLVGAKRQSTGPPPSSQSKRERADANLKEALDANADKGESTPS